GEAWDNSLSGPVF
nr:immunoglobulin light chain junction region [Macaca mulatta]